MRRLTGIIATVALASLPLPAASSPLKSLTDRADILGWEAVGRLNLEGRGYCSASLIAPDIVMTAAHCLFAPEHARRIDPTTLTFHAGLRDGDAIASGRILRAVVPAAYDPTDEMTAENIRNDVALLQLAEPIPATTADPFPLGRGGVGRSVTVLSYGRGRSNAMSREIGCMVLAARHGLMAFDCQAEPGSSGAPIFDMSGFSPRIVAIVSGGGLFDGRKVVYGMEVESVVSGLRQALRTGDGVWPRPEPTTRRVIGLSERAAGSARFVRP